jgi:hypothetical protein
MPNELMKKAFFKGKLLELYNRNNILAKSREGHQEVETLSAYLFGRFSLKIIQNPRD